jgi:hypothetical protein
MGGVDFHRPPTGKGWTWKSDLTCTDLVEGVITQCLYAVTMAGSVGARSVAMFVDGRLSVLGVSYSSPSVLVQQALVDKLGTPTRLPSRSNGGWSALRWDNGTSVVEFQENYCGSGIWAGAIPREWWSSDVAEVLRGSYCESRDGGNAPFGFIWFVHRPLFSLTVRRWEEGIKEIKRKAQSEIFTFDDELGMNLEDFKRHRRPEALECKETAATVTECSYLPTILGVRFFAKAIFAGDKLAAVHLNNNYQPQVRVISGMEVPVDIRQALIAKLGPPGIIRGYEDPAITVEDRRALHWDDGTSVVEYQGSDCHAASEGDEYKRITKILQRLYCEKGESGDGTYSIWRIDKTLFGAAMARHKEAEEDARRKARSDM